MYTQTGVYFFIIKIVLLCSFFSPSFPRFSLTHVITPICAPAPTQQAPVAYTHMCKIHIDVHEHSTTSNTVNDFQSIVLPPLITVAHRVTFTFHNYNKTHSPGGTGRCLLFLQYSCGDVISIIIR